MNSTTVLLAGVLLASLLLTGCAPTLGAHVHKFHLRRVEFVKCTVISERADVHFAEQSLEVCRDAFGMVPTAEREKR